MHDILEDISTGKGSMDDLVLLEEMATFIKEASLCGLGKTAPNPVLSTLRYFQDEYRAHIKDKRCPAGVCKALITYSIDKKRCIGCGACIKACPAEAVRGAAKKPHTVLVNKCIKCGACYEVCPVDAVVK
jgi:ferredoxin